MTGTFLSLTVSPSFNGGFIVTLLEDVGGRNTKYILRYRESSVPFTSLENPDFAEGDQRDEREIPEEQAQRVMALLKDASVTPVPPYALGLDGTTYLLHVSNGSNEARYTWWVNIPDGWEPLGKVCAALLALAGKES